MKITIECTPKEIADLAVPLQDRQNDKLIAEQMTNLSEASKLCLNTYESLEVLPALTAAMISLAKL